MGIPRSLRRIIQGEGRGRNVVRFMSLKDQLFSLGQLNFYRLPVTLRQLLGPHPSPPRPSHWLPLAIACRKSFMLSLACRMPFFNFRFSARNISQVRWSSLTSFFRSQDSITSCLKITVIFSSNSLTSCCRSLLNFNLIKKIINQGIPEFVLGRIAHKTKINYRKNDSLADHSPMHRNPAK